MADRFEVARALQGFGAGVQGRGPEFLQNLDDRRKGAMLQDAFKVMSQLEGGDIASARDTLMNRLDAIQQLGGDPSDTIGVLNRLDQGDIGGALSDVSTVVEFAQAEGLLPGVTQTGSMREFEQLTQGLSDEEVQQAREFKLGLRARPSSREDVEDAATRARRLAEARGEGKGTEGRRQTAIDLGVSAAKGIPILRRSLSLLDRVETGGIDAANLRAKQLFGVEGADEGELSANLGKAVLGQLKTIFGSQFTEKEGSRLERIEAGFGKSQKTNRRLLRQALTIVNNAVDLALDANPDERTRDELLDFTEGRFDLTDEGLAEIFNPQAAQAQQQPQGRGLQEGATATNPQTGQKLIVRDGQWQPL